MADNVEANAGSGAAQGVGGSTVRAERDLRARVMNPGNIVGGEGGAA